MPNYARKPIEFYTVFFFFGDQLKCKYTENNTDEYLNIYRKPSLLFSLLIVEW